MNKTIYAVQGTADLGKTETLNILIDLLSSVAYNYSIEKYNEGTNDRHASFTINKTKICVCTAGDNEDEANGNLAYIKKNKADVVFTACHETSSTARKALKEYAEEKHYEFITEQKIDDEKESRRLALKYFKIAIGDCEE